MGNALIRSASWTATLCALLVLAGWGVGRGLSDRAEWSQFVFWAPTPAVLALTGLLLLIGTGLARWARRISGSSCRIASRTRAGAWCVWLVILTWMLGSEWHVLRFIRPVTTPAGTPSVRVLYWNAVGSKVPDLVARILDQKPDVLITANAPQRADWVAIRAGLAEHTSAMQRGRISIVSRFPIIRWGATNLKITGARARVFAWRGGGYVIIDQGEAVYAELDTTSTLGHTTVVWCLDLPSDPNLSRWVVMREASTTLDFYPGPEYHRNAAGLDDAAPLHPAGFPKPDLVVGDFNTPRGSASMMEVADGMTHAFEQSGRGYAATWPREWPVFAIDQAFISPRLRSTMYRILDMQSGEHRAEVMDLVAADH